MARWLMVAVQRISRWHYRRERRCRISAASDCNEFEFCAILTGSAPRAADLNLGGDHEAVFSLRQRSAVRSKYTSRPFRRVGAARSPHQTPMDAQSAVRPNCE